MYFTIQILFFSVDGQKMDGLTSKLKKKVKKSE